jgi:hypothetical protein
MNDTDAQDIHSDDQSVLTFLLQHVRGLKPVSTIDDLSTGEDISFS